ncbi:MAG: PIN domain-containing protein [Verrucomicrobiota bacterium]
MRIFLDTNILLDQALPREAFAEEAERVLQVCTYPGNSALIEWHTFTNLYYVMRRAKGNDATRSYLRSLVKWVKLAPTGLGQLSESLKADTGDLEDILQGLCARDGGADVIVTRDPRGFQTTSVRALSPKDFLAESETA